MTKSGEPPRRRLIIDVAYPGTSVANSSSRPILVTNRPAVKDPMVVEGSSVRAIKDLSITGDTPNEHSSPTTAPLLPGTKPLGSVAIVQTAAPRVNPEPQAFVAENPGLHEDLDSQDNPEDYRPPHPYKHHHRHKLLKSLIGFLVLTIVVVIGLDLALDKGLIKIGNIKPVTHIFEHKRATPLYNL